jgi:hypothetical protein
MDKTEKKKFIIRSLAQIVFVSWPAIFLSGYLVYRLRPLFAEWSGLTISDFAYSMALLLVMVAVMHLTTKNIFRVLKNERSQREGDSA